MSEQAKWIIEQTGTAYQLEHGYVCIYNGRFEVARCGFGRFTNRLAGLIDATNRAKRIVQAVNNHDDLLGELREASACPPDSDLIGWVRMLADAWGKQQAAAAAEEER